MYFDIPSPGISSPLPTTRIYVDRGAAPWQAQRPTLVCIHGVLCDHSVWQPVAADVNALGWNIAAIDLPGHGLSSGPAPRSVQEAAAWLPPLLDAMGLAQAALMGHSWGSLIALEAAAQLGPRIGHLALVGTASPMAVAPALLALAQSDPPQAMALIDKYSRSRATPADFDGQALSKKVFASNPGTNLLVSGLQACDAYQNALAAMQQVTANTLFIVGADDRMTPASAAQPLIAAAQGRSASAASRPGTTVAHLASGHLPMVDAPGPMLDALGQWLPRSAKAG
ncbi:MAG: alpha/beta hydrolase [Comamonas sp.]|nr:alpha/beta hydrolase [Comamonas sp.]